MNGEEGNKPLNQKKILAINRFMDRIYFFDLCILNKILGVMTEDYVS